MTQKTPYPKIEERPLPDKFGAGMSWLARWTLMSDGEKRAFATWLHTMIGTLWGTDAYFRFISTLASTDYGIGGIRDGAYDGVIFRWINYFERDMTAGWASGWSKSPDYDGDGEALVQQGGVKAINGTGRSVELSGLVADIVTSKQWSSTIHLLAAIHHNEIGQGYEEYEWDMHHKEVAEKDCPFPRVYRYTLQYQRGVKLIMEHFETGRDIPDTIQIAGLDVPLFGGQDAPYNPDPGKPLFIPFAKPIEFTSRASGESHEWAFQESRIVRKYAGGSKLRAKGYYYGEEIKGDDRWLVITSPGVSNNARIHERDVREAIPDPAIMVKAA